MPRKRIYLWYIPLLKKLYVCFRKENTLFYLLLYGCQIHCGNWSINSDKAHYCINLLYALCFKQIANFISKIKPNKVMFYVWSYGQRMSDAFRNCIMIYVVWGKVSKEIMVFKAYWENKCASSVYVITYFNCQFNKKKIYYRVTYHVPLQCIIRIKLSIYR